MRREPRPPIVELDDRLPGDPTIPELDGVDEVVDPVAHANLAVELRGGTERDQAILRAEPVPTLRRRADLVVVADAPEGEVPPRFGSYAILLG